MDGTARGQRASFRVLLEVTASCGATRVLFRTGRIFVRRRGSDETSQDTWSTGRRTPGVLEPACRRSPPSRLAARGSGRSTHAWPMKRYYVFLLSATLGPGCVAVAPLTIGIPERATSASIISLLGQPAVYAGQRVAVSGFLAPDWEGPTLFFTSEQCRRYSAADGIALKLGDGIWHDAFLRRRAPRTCNIAGAITPRWWVRSSLSRSSRCGTMSFGLATGAASSTMLHISTSSESPLPITARNRPRRSGPA